MKKGNSRVLKSLAIIPGLLILISCIFTSMYVYADEELPPQIYINSVPAPVKAVTEDNRLRYRCLLSAVMRNTDERSCLSGGYRMVMHIVSMEINGQ